MLSAMNRDGSSKQERVSRRRRSLLDVFARIAKVVQSEELGPRFRRFTLEGSALRHVSWQPGDKVQFVVRGVTLRTYTPLWWDADKGQMSVVAYLHGTGPANEWALNLSEGQMCSLFGPRRSLDLRKAAPAMLFGDETCLGLAVAAQAQRHHDLRFVCECDAPVELQPVVDALALSNTVLVAREEGHLDTIVDLLFSDTPVDREIVLAGAAPSIQHIRKGLRDRGMSATRMRSRAYWAPGKRGLD